MQRPNLYSVAKQHLNEYFNKIIMTNVLGVEAGKRLIENVSSLISFKLCTTYPLDQFIHRLIPFICWQSFHSSFIRRDVL